MKTAIGYSYYNDLEPIKRGIPTFINEVDYVFAIDGRFSLREGPDYSDDGSTEYLSGFPNVLFRKFVGMEHDKRQQYIEMAKEHNISVLIILDTDEYIVEADWPLFKSNLEKLLDNPQNMHGLECYYNATDTTPYPRIWVRPQEISYYHAHCIFNVNGQIMRSPSAIKSVKGVKMRMDDTLRDEEYLKKTSEYQGRMIEYEKPIRKHAWDLHLDKILDS